MIHYKTSEEIEMIKESAQILGKAHAEIARMIKPGAKTSDMDKMAEEFIRDHGGVPSFLNYNGFPYTLCVSPNEQVVHGFPSELELEDGDILSIDCGVFFKGFHSDSAYTYPVGEVEEEKMQLLRVTKESLYKGIDEAVVGKRVGDISYAVQHHVEGFGYTVVRELVGHGVGKELHESPEVPNYGKRGKGPKLKEGMVIAIEPMINLGKKEIVQESDGWTIRTRDRTISAHYEHTIAIANGKPEVLTTHDYIEEVFKF
jgi:methionyl aminopeptidase